MKILNKIKYYIIFAFLAAFVIFSVAKLPVELYAQENDDCLACHEDKTLTVTHGKKVKSLFVEKKKLGKSIHSTVKCIQCHVGLNPDDLPHAKNPLKVDCSNCHKAEQMLYNECLHGKSSNKGDPLAPKCQTCHGSHEIVANKEKQSPVYPLNIPKLCGKCHKEGSPVQLQRNIPQTHILENYSESIHGEGLIKKGLTVSATCASCHSPHRILPHTDPRSTINRKNIAATCTKCHSGIEYVHKKVIKDELWKKEAKVLPACIDCHQPHKVRKVFYEQNLSDANCRKCHENPGIGKSADGRKMNVKHNEIMGSVHSKVTCTQCHTMVEPSADRPCVPLKSNRVDCSSCHIEVGNDYKMSIHGKLSNIKDEIAPRCATCHGSHNILKKTNENSPTFSLNIPNLCSKCHNDGKPAELRMKGNKHIIGKYAESIHGKGLIKGGLTVTANCADCHTAHKTNPKSDPKSSVNKANISQTCGRCHYGVQEYFDKSVHSPLVNKTDKKLPTCDDCHSAHDIKRTDKNTFRHEVLSTCGKCHMDIASTYFDTYHGKVSRLGNDKAAKCSDCHGSHDITKLDDKHSKLNRDNIVSTCQKCHKNANKGFVKYLTHATHHDPDKYPFLFYSFWGMTLLLLGTFSISFLHTLLWIPRSFKMRKKMKALHAAHKGVKDQKLYQRFNSFNRTLHFVMIISFITLATTGMTVKFSYTTWAHYMAGMMGGVDNAGILHRYAATALFIVFIFHIYDLFRKKNNEYKTWKNMLFGPDSMIPNKKDLADIKASMKWFLGKGPRPQYGRWTYWEKFDYFAVFWGIFIIGSTGLTLWFPELFTYIFPGSLINVATIVHSDEALLAAGFIFTVHFFNTHFRPEKFPMDTVIFSGQMTLEELKIERPAEYEYLIATNQLEKYMTPPFSESMLKMLKIFGWCALTLGLLLVVWIIYAMLIG